MSITLQDVAYQLGLRIDREPVSGCISGWFEHYNGQIIEDICLDLLRHVPTEGDRQKGVAAVHLFPDASDSRVHLRWLPLLADLEQCGRLSWGSVVLHSVLQPVAL
ncbi:hypothetical protein PIB30_028010 [Stylosanthes scabra]|uniref:Uncharacterized protein n=1 Tax=Stylosanthes scabra TaxID=79078 RepID=A0ABU6YCN1_9FABA|nr:hypothetical protein [Stylosanthes scabra]